MAASPGFEPRLTESESAVLPLDDEAISSNDPFIIRFILSVNTFSYNFSQNLIAKKKRKNPFDNDSELNIDDLDISERQRNALKKLDMANQLTVTNIQL